MPIASMLVHTVSIVTPTTTTDRYGSEVKVWAGSGSSSPAWMRQRSTLETVEGREARSSDWVAFLPAGTSVTAMDRIVWDGRTFEVAGDPLKAHGRTGEVHHIEAPLRIVEG